MLGGAFWVWVCRVATPEGLTGPKWCFSLYTMEGDKEAMKDEFMPKD